MNATLIYDGDCPLCCKAMDWVRANAVGAKLDFVSCQDETRQERFPQISEAACMEAIQFVEPDGAVYAADEALPHIFRRLKRWRWVARVLRLPIVRAMSPHAYRFIARRRHVFSVLVAKKVTEDTEQCAS